MQIRDAGKTDKDDTYADKRGAGKTDTDVTEGDKTERKEGRYTVENTDGNKTASGKTDTDNTDGDLPLQYGHVIKLSSKWIIIQNTDDTAHVH